ncbi:MAG TPA: DDE-type integrase/transposase/recombinase, partial [Polyangiaceae bacterium]|nr:DDE-type integrase/transposase/recombinase [Polyangiaceae bacterium]
MVAAAEPVPLPDEWPEQTRSGLLQALGLLRVAVYTVRGWAENSPLAKARLQGEVERLETEVALLQQELRLKNARMARIEAARRPHYTPVERLEILMLGVTRGWSMAELARRFLLTATTIAQWNRRRDEHGPEALLRTREPVNKFPDLVSALVQQLQALLPIAGRRKLAEHLARAGLHLSASTVKRRLEAEVAPPMPPDDPSISGGPAATSAMKKEAPRAVVARATNHVWGADLTLVPLLGGFAVPWLPFAWAQRWPFCWWVLLVVDHFSRSVVHVALFAQQPKEAEVVAALERAVSATGPPKHFITDQGVQFQGGYRAFC